MTAVQYVEEIMDANWTPSITGRDTDVPKPNIEREGQIDKRRMNAQRDDQLIISDGGISDISPQSFAWQEESTVARVTIDTRTTHSRERLWGHRDGSNDAERYGGLMGEQKRIIDSKRNGHKEFDLIIGYEQNDLSGQMGGKVWRGTYTIRLEVRATTIDSST